MPYGTDSRLNEFQAINCLATIIQSLRDKIRELPSGRGCKGAQPSVGSFQISMGRVISKPEHSILKRPHRLPLLDLIQSWRGSSASVSNLVWIESNFARRQNVRRAALSGFPKTDRYLAMRFIWMGFEEMGQALVQ